MQAKKSSKFVQDQVVILPINKTQDYAWGCKDKNCLVGSMTKQTFETYAEFWMGTHPNGQSKITTDTSFKQYLAQNGIKEISFLFKILSIEKCLSIQAHPSLQEAKQLHKDFPQIYVDDRDKPQMMLTLSDHFQLFLGFIQQKELQSLLKIEPFKTLSSFIESIQHKQKVLFMLEKLVYLDEAELKTHIQILIENLAYFEEKRQIVLKKIFDQFQYDTGILVSCLLQHHILPKGACVGIQAGVPHAYIKGECFELMRNSDNVVRLGLTPKKKDIPNLMKILRNNIDNHYCQIECKQNECMNKFQWKQYSIIVWKMHQKETEIEIESNSIGILLNGHSQVYFSNNQTHSIQLSSKTVFFIQKGLYLFKGQGEIFIASKA